MFTVDASVHVNATDPTEAGSLQSEEFLTALGTRHLAVFAPTFVLVEVATAVARKTNDAAEGVTAAHRIRGLPAHTWVPVDDLLAEEAVQLGTQCRLRGADAVYAAVAKRHGCKLVTRDQQQLDRLKDALTCLTPEEALAQLGSPGDSTTGGTGG